jgi:hypothetical protein
MRIRERREGEKECCKEHKTSHWWQTTTKLRPEIVQQHQIYIISARKVETSAGSSGRENRKLGCQKSNSSKKNSQRSRQRIITVPILHDGNKSSTTILSLGY